MKSQKYIAFLRAVNVGGRVVKMESLRELFEELGLTSVRSYIQSGNVFFETEGKDTKAARAALERRIEKYLEDALGFEVPVFLRTVPEVEKIVGTKTFDDVEVTPDTRLLVLFASGPLPKDAKLPYSPPKGDLSILAAVGQDLLVVSQNTNGRPGNPAAVVEKNFKIKVTGRFFATLAKILDAAKAE